MVITPLRESHSARGNQRIYAPKGPPEAVSPGGPLHDISRHEGSFYGYAMNGSSLRVRVSWRLSSQAGALSGTR
jgi:hypothetical protein